MRREVERKVEDYDRERVVRVVRVGGGMIRKKIKERGDNDSPKAFNNLTQKPHAWQEIKTAIILNI